jgi:CMP-N,N'-diacetyllegionaminic acid synthase
LNKKEKVIIGLIPARGGSKGVPGKNLREVHGQPLISYAIKCALKCRFIDHVVVSTDSDQIARIAKQNGAEVPFVRPANLAQDKSAMRDVLWHALLACEAYYGGKVDCIILLDPTAPLRRISDVTNAYKLFEKGKCDAVISGNIAHRNPYFNMVRQSGCYVRLVSKRKKEVFRRQDCPQVFDLNTVVWIYSRKAIAKKKRIPKNSLLYLVPKEFSIDLDTEYDFKVLESLMKMKRK